ncbi:MAG: hypothetical protein Q7J07_09515 [Pelolinea sp.]|nr:hypothetical protein [Pelolinea sp.]
MRKFIATLLVIFLVFPLLLSAQAVISVSSWALDRQFYIDAFAQEQVFSTLTSGPMIEKLLYDQLNLPPEANIRELKSVITAALTPEYMREQVNAIINSLFDYLQGKADSFSPTLDIVPLKTALQGDQQEVFLTTLVAALPTCEPGQIAGFGGEGRTACKPSGVSDEQLIEQSLKPALPGIIAVIPDEIPLESTFTTFQETSRWRSFIPGMAVPASIVLSLLVLVCIAVCAWYITALIADPSWHVRLQWLGWMLLIPAVLVFLIGFADQSGVPAFWIRFGLERANLSAVPFGSSLGDTIQVVTTAALPRVASAFKMVGGISAGIALALIFWGIATPRRRPEQIV